MPSTIRDLTELLAVAVDDYILISDTSDVTNRDKRISKANFSGGLMTGGGTLATGGFTLTLTGNGTLNLGGFTLTAPATGTAALKTGTPVGTRLAMWSDANTLQDANINVASVAQINAFQTYTRGITINPPTGDIGLLIDTVSNPTERPLRIRMNGVERFSYLMNNTNNQLSFLGFDNGTGGGPIILVGPNANASTPTPGQVIMTQANGTNASIYPDNSAVWRTFAGGVNNGNFASGTVIGAQTSRLAAKTVLGAGIAPAAALSKLLETPVIEFEYKNGGYNGSRFQGIVADWSPEFAMDEGRVFSPVSAFGYTVQSIKELTRRLAAAENELATLRGGN
jgi:hypothetical protein